MNIVAFSCIGFELTSIKDKKDRDLPTKIHIINDKYVLLHSLIKFSFIFTCLHINFNFPFSHKLALRKFTRYIS